MISIINIDEFKSIIKYFGGLIVKSDNENEIESVMDILLSIQTYLAIKVYKDKVEVNSGLKEFISDFDRADNRDHRNLLVQKIKQNELTYLL